MRNSTGSIQVQKSNIVEIRDDEEDDMDDDAVIIDENGGNGGGGGGVDLLHSSLMLPSGTSITSHPTSLDDLMDTTEGPSDFPPIPHFLMDTLMAGGGADADDPVGSEEYKCEACGKTFGKMTSLHMHSFQHDPNKEMKCIFCNFLFLQRSSLNRHYRCRDSLHTCRVCKQAFCSHLNLRQHACTGEGAVVGAGGGGGNYAESSLMIAEGDENEYIDLSDMAKQENRKRNRAGNAMGVNSEDVSGRDESIELSDTEPDSLVCLLCSQVMNTKAELDQHVVTEHGTVTKCPVCFKGFRSPTILHIHMLARASKKNKIECTACTHRFSKPAELRKHFMYHTMREARPGMTDEAIYSRIAQKYPGK